MEDGRRFRLATLAGNQLGQAEVQHLNDAILAQHDVLRLDVTMDDSGLMRRGQRRCDLRGETEQFTHRHWRLNHALSQGFALDEFRGDELMRIYLADLVNGQDVGMVQRGSGASFLLKSPHALSIASEESRQHFQRHLRNKCLASTQENSSLPSAPSCSRILLPPIVPPHSDSPWS